MAKILLIENNASDARSVILALAREGHIVRHLQHMVDLAGILKRMSPDVVIIDGHMPGFSGSTLSQFIRTRCGSEVPIILRTSQAPDAGLWIRKDDSIENLSHLVLEVTGKVA